MHSSRKIFTLLPLFLSLAACGGGGSGEPTGSAPTGLRFGQFKDSNTAGLHYDTGTRSGITDEAGWFSYEPGEKVVFAVGNVVLGSAPGKPVVTPQDLVPGGGSGDTEVLNRVRFLMMLDADGNPDNGITISPEVRQAANGWSQVDFTTGDLALELADIMSSAREADGGTHLLPGATEAQAHLEATLYCALAGIYTGSFIESWDDGPDTDFTDSGFFTGKLDPDSGYVTASGYSVPGQQAFFATGISKVGFDGEPEFVSGDTTSGATFRGRFADDDIPEVTGTWERPYLVGTPQGPLPYKYGGEFQAERLPYRAEATLLIVALDEAFGVTLDVDADGRIRGHVVDTSTGQPIAVEGMMDEGGGTFSVEDDNGLIQISGQRNDATGDYEITIAGHDQVLRADHCNPN
ncbi:MAG TPA: hypothetical protein ENI93_00005 [Gammaproteobacteria bacterium]|nr:hypothetical protein [Gammaproteobacteria bacterium]